MPGVTTAPAKGKTDHFVNVGLRYLHSSGLSAGLSETFRWERFNTVNWQNSPTWPAEGRQDQKIWLTDAQIAYAFPRKKGMLAFEMRNIFDQRFNWVTDYYVYKGRSPSRETFLTLTFNF